MILPKKLLSILIGISFFSPSLLLAGEGNMYDFNWLDSDKFVYVLQKKIYEKNNTFYVNAGYGWDLTSEFQDSNLIHANLGYYFSEEWGVEALFSKVGNNPSSSLNNLQAKNNVIPFIRRFNDFYGGAVIFSPFYAKINTFNKIIYFDWNFGLGVVQMNSENNGDAYLNNDNTLAFKKESEMGYLAKTQIRIYIIKHLTLNLDFIKTYYRVSSPGSQNEEFDSTTDMVLSLGSYL